VKRGRLVPCGIALLVALGGAATTGAAQGPFYLVPSTTKECQNVPRCRSVHGPWVAVPAHGEATFLFGCPERRGFLIGGTDARASSEHVRVWFEGKLGARTGLPASVPGQPPVLLFHAAVDNGRIGSFLPILGCVELTESSKRATESARRVGAVPGTSPTSGVSLRAEMVALNLATGLTRVSTTLSCRRNERAVGSWGALALNTAGPPSARYARAVTIRTVAVGRTVHATFHTERTFGALTPQAWAQVGAICEP
jgi:hypothetical protein